MGKQYDVLDGLLRLKEILDDDPNPNCMKLGKLSESTTPDGGPTVAVGICTWLCLYCDSDSTGREKLDTLLESWPEGTGSPYYPIPSPDGFITAEGAYSRNRAYPFNPDVPYCQSRLRLLDWLIEQYQAEKSDG